MLQTMLTRRYIEIPTPRKCTVAGLLFLLVLGAFNYTTWPHGFGFSTGKPDVTPSSGRRDHLLVVPELVISSEPTLSQGQPNLSDFDDMLQLYITEHSSAALAKEPPCTGQGCRRFVVGRYVCPTQIGNRIHAFLNNFMLAIVTNRTFIWRYGCSAERGDDIKSRECKASKDSAKVSPPSECSKYWHRRAWLPSFDEAQRNAPNQLRKPAKTVYIGCGVDEKIESLPFVHLIRAEWQEVGSLAPQAPPVSTGFRWKTQAANERARLLFELGPHRAYGSLFRAVFDVDFELKSKVDSILPRVAPYLPSDSSTGGKEFVIAVHIRHHYVANEASDRTSKVQLHSRCIRKAVAEERMKWERATLSKTKAIFKCAIVLATDRLAAIEAIKDVAQEPGVGCRFVEFPRESPDVEDTTAKSSFGLTEEHGPFTGYVALADIELLGQADAFIGHKGSTFSLLIAERIASRINLPDTAWSRWVMRKSLTDDGGSCTDAKALKGTNSWKGYSGVVVNGIFAGGGSQCT